MLLSLLLFAFFGYVVGLVTRLIVGGPGGTLETAAVGMAGAVIGGLFARGVGWMRVPWSATGILAALMGAVALVLVARLVRAALARAPG